MVRLFLAGLLAVLLLAAAAPQALAGHVQCGDVITQDTKLDSDLIDCPSDGIVIGADNITLDLGGHTVDGDDVFPEQPWIDCEAGIVNGPWDIVPNVPMECARPGQQSHDGVTIRNGALRGFYYGVRIRGTDGGLVRKLMVSGTHTGISLAESNNARVEANSLSENRSGYAATGIFLGDAENSRIERNYMSQNGGYGLEAFDGVNNNTIERNLVAGNELGGIHMHGSRYNLVAQNRVSDSPTGIEISDSVSGNHVSSNWVFRNADAGIVVQDGATENRVDRNFVFDNGNLSRSVESGGIVVRYDGHDQRVSGNSMWGNHQGIVLSDSAGTNRIERNWVSLSAGGGIVLRQGVPFPSSIDLLEHNVVTRNGGDGIFFDEAAPTADLRWNLARANGDDGIDVEDTHTTLAGNTANRNSDLGIEAVPGVADGGGNRAFGNGNPLQCLNVACK